MPDLTEERVREIAREELNKPVDIREIAENLLKFQNRHTAKR